MEKITTERVIEIFNALKENSEDTEFTQAIDHAINCVGAIDQIKWERDIAIQQLNELGLELGQKTNKVKQIIETYLKLDKGHALKHSSKNVIQYNREWLYKNLDTEFGILKSVAEDKADKELENECNK